MPDVELVTKIPIGYSGVVGAAAAADRTSGRAGGNKGFMFYLISARAAKAPPAGHICSEATSITRR